MKTNEEIESDEKAGEYAFELKLEHWLALAVGIGIGGIIIGALVGKGIIHFP